MIGIGIPLTLELSEDDKSIRYRCRVVERKGASLYVDYPINERTGRTGIFHTGTEFRVSFLAENKVIYSFNTRVIGKENINIPTLVLSYSKKDLVRIQRREFVRIDANLDIAIHDPKGEFSPLTTVTRDISGGGASLIVPKESSFHQDMLLDIWIVLPMSTTKISYINAIAKIIRIADYKDASNVMSIKFQDITDHNRDLIIRYCFEQQLKARKKSIQL